MFQRPPGSAVPACCAIPAPLKIFSSDPETRPSSALGERGAGTALTTVNGQSMRRPAPPPPAPPAVNTAAIAGGAAGGAALALAVLVMLLLLRRRRKAATKPSANLQLSGVDAPEAAKARAPNLGNVIFR